MRTKAVILTEIISPYRIKPFNLLFDDSGVDLQVWFMAETEHRRKWRVATEEIRFPYRVMHGMEVARLDQGSPVFLNPGVMWRLARARADVVVCGGWHHPTNWLAAASAKAIGARLLLWSESTAQDHRRVRSVKETVKRWMVRQADGYVVPGTAQAEYLRYLGAEEERIWTVPNCVDNDFFSHGVVRPRQRREHIKRILGITGPIVLYVGRIREEKGVDDLLKAFHLAAHGGSATLVLVGDGPDEARYRDQAQGMGLTNVRFVGFQPQRSLPLFYGVADIFVFPTHSDPWGLVMNEAMASGLPIISSTSAGATPDLLRAPYNGFTYEAGNVTRLAELFRLLLGDESLRLQMGRCSAAIIQEYTPATMATAFSRAILEVRHDHRQLSA